MFIAHLPAGYLLSRKLTRTPTLLCAGLVGSLLPDLDLLYFYLVDARQHLHHSYWTHLPFWWLAIGAAALLAARLARSKKALAAIGMLLANVLLHLLLDTWAGHIRWLWPFSNRGLALVSVPAHRSWWLASFLLHWTFLAEVCIVALAAAAFALDRRRRRAVAGAEIEEARGRR